MEIILPNIITGVDAGSAAAVPKALETLHLPQGEVLGASLYRTSVDARRGQVKFVSSVCLDLTEGGLARLARRGITYTPLESAEPVFCRGSEPLCHRPVVIGLGPGGLFAALILARQGYRPLVLERGGDIDTRTKAVRHFWETGELSEVSNVQFGEGGAGTFSDGKLTTRINDPLCRFVLRQFVRHGAPRDILVRAKPHVGTDRLREVVRSIRQEIVSLGGEVRFETRADGFFVRGGRICGIAAGGADIPADAVIAAVGHSARDTFEALERCGAQLVPKAFSVGVRIEHRQADIDRALYGRYAGHGNLPQGEYQLSWRNAEGRAAYTFCMCPGGQVVAAASEPGRVVTNGMSNLARDGKNANAALAVSVSPADFGQHWRDGIAFQRRIEGAAYTLGGGGYRAPAMTVGDFLGTGTAGGDTVSPTYAPGVTDADISGVFPAQVNDMLRTALPILGRRLAGFDAPTAVLTAAETRTSSPVRIERGENYCALGIDALYPCGEGAGYAGGIMSAAVDGLRCAGALMSRFGPAGD